MTRRHHHARRHAERRLAQRLPELFGLEPRRTPPDGDERPEPAPVPPDTDHAQHAATEPPAVAAFDLSLTATGHASPIGSGVLTPPSNLKGVPRLRWIRAAVLDRVPSGALVALEGYAFGARGRAIVSLGELGGVVRVALADCGARWVDIPPSVRAKYATGKGNAPKDAVLAAAIRRLGYAGHDHNEADALWLRALVLDALGHPLVTVPAAHREALATVLPELERAA